MPYLIMMAILGVWAYFALRDRPLAYYLSLFFACSLLIAIAEPVATLVLHLFAWRPRLLGDFHRDRAVGSLLIEFYLDPLLGVLFARYAEPRPVLKAGVTAVLLGWFEVWLRQHGYILYSGWHSLYSMLAFLGYFLIIWWLTLRPWPIPHWLHVLGFNMWLGHFFGIVFQALLGLWHFNVHPWYWERVFSIMLHTLLIVAPATAIAVLPLARRWLWGAAGLAFLAAAWFLLDAAGLMRFGWVGLTAILTQYCTMIWLATCYSAWLGRHEPAKVPPPWEPPTELRET